MTTPYRTSARPKGKGDLNWWALAARVASWCGKLAGLLMNVLVAFLLFGAVPAGASSFFFVDAVSATAITLITTGVSGAFWHYTWCEGWSLLAGGKPLSELYAEHKDEPLWKV